ncbi:MAG: hypothetical protein AB7I01_07080 [Gammaproteobacteria bacterium]
MAAAALGLLLPALAAAAAGWNTRPAPDTRATPWAVVKSDGGDELALYRDGEGKVRLRLWLHGTFATLAPRQCPTFQVDADKPPHHATLDRDCHVEAREALVDLGIIQNRALTSAAVDQIMNGERIHVRFRRADGGYQETVFPLKRSSAAIRRALGRDVRVRER